MSSAVIESLRSSSKGHLRYDPCGETSIQTIIDDVTKSMNCLLISPLKSPDTTPRDVKAKSSNPKPVVKPSKSRPPVKEQNEDTPAEIQTKVFLSEYENERKIAVQNSLRQRKDMLDNESNIFSYNAREHFEEWQRKQEQLRRQIMEEQLNLIEDRKLKVKQKQQNLKEHNEKHNRLITTKIKESELRQKQLEQENLEKLRALRHQQELMDSLLKCQREVNEKYTNVLDKIKACPQKQMVSESVKTLVYEQHHVAEAINQLISTSKERHLTDDDLKIAQSLVQQVDSNAERIISAIDAATVTTTKPSTILTPTKDPVSTVQKTITNPQTNISQPIIIPESSGLVRSDHQISASNDLPEIYQHISRSALTEYIKLQNLAIKYSRSFADLLNDSSPRMKTYRFDLQKGINIPVNAISPRSGSHLRDKLTRLKCLLQGQPVDVGDKRVSTRDHPQATALCKDLLAKKFVKQADEQISSKYESAFAIVSVIIGLWSEVEDFGDLFLAHLHKKCPYTIPYYVARDEGQSDEDYYKAQGYYYTDNVVEKQDKFLKRMSGMLRLYAAIICSPVPFPGVPHPHGIENGWKWMVRILNLEPRPDVTATLLYDFLETAGHEMQITYGKQFQKLIAFLCTDYLPKIRAVTPVGAGGPLVRLENFLEKCLRHNRIPPPQGIISANFWFT